MTDDERREHLRAPIELKVEYKKMNTFFADYTKNISKGGTFIKTEKPLPMGTEFVFRLVVPVQEAPFELRGRVMWINTEHHPTDPERTDPGMGIKFLYVDDKQRSDFEGHVEALMTQELGEHLVKKLVKKS